MVTTIKSIITSYFHDVWPVIIIITVIATSLRIAYLIKNRQRFCFYKEISVLLFILYVMCLFEIVTLQDYNYGLSNYIVFILSSNRSESFDSLLIEYLYEYTVPLEI